MTFPNILPTALSVGSSLLDYFGQKGTNAANAEQAQRQMDFQERMSNTSYQRAVADMRAAGLNPALAYTQGGASSPSGSSATMDNPLAHAANNAIAVAQTSAQLAATKAQIAKTEAETRNTDADTRQLQLESAARAAEIDARARLTGTNADFGKDTYDDRKAATHWQMKGDEAGYFGQLIHNRGEAQLVDPENKFVARGLRAQLVAAQLRNTDTDTSSVLQRMEALGLQLPGMRNQAASDNTMWGRMFRPYLNDAHTILQGAATLRGIFPREESSTTDNHTSDTFYDRTGQATGGRSSTTTQHTQRRR